MGKGLQINGTITRLDQPFDWEDWVVHIETEHWWGGGTHTPRTASVAMKWVFVHDDSRTDLVLSDFLAFLDKNQYTFRGDVTPIDVDKD